MLDQQTPDDGQPPQRDDGGRRRTSGATQRESSQTSRLTKIQVVAVLFVISLFIPWIIPVGPLRMTLTRLILLAALIPCLVLWLKGQAGPKRIADFALLAYCAWYSLSIVVNNGTGPAFEPTGIMFAETMGSYLLARCAIRNADDLHRMIRLLFLCILAMLPFQIFESVTGFNLARAMYEAVWTTLPDVNYEPRWGLRRVQAIFDHPILTGVFCGGAVGLTYAVLGYDKSFVKRWMMTSLMALAAALSLSAGPMTAVIGQFALIGYNTVLARVAVRWHLLIGAILAFVVFAEVFTNQSLPARFISYFAFDQVSAYYRILIWTYGTISIGNNPLFGVGLNDWMRPEWMPPSIDMFWIITAVYSGLPAQLFFDLAYFSIFVLLVAKKDLSPRVHSYRMGFIYVMVGFFLVGWTVHFWNASYILLLFLMGACLWIPEVQPSREGADVAAEPSGRRALRQREPRLVRSHRRG